MTGVSQWLQVISNPPAFIFSCSLQPFYFLDLDQGQGKDGCVLRQIIHICLPFIVFASSTSIRSHSMWLEQWNVAVHHPGFAERFMTNLKPWIIALSYLVPPYVSPSIWLCTSNLKVSSIYGERVENLELVCVGTFCWCSSDATNTYSNEQLPTCKIHLIFTGLFKKSC